jgi:hypothetical protein
MNAIEMNYKGNKITISVGNIYNKLKIINLFKVDYKWYATCECECGKIVDKICVRSLLTGNTKSCGCYNKELTIRRNLKHGQKTRGKKTDRLYSIWSDMRRRCSNPNRPRAKNYVLKNITVCNEWNDYKNFMDWALSHGYDDTLTLERIDNSKNYCPENCK